MTTLYLSIFFPLSLFSAASTAINDHFVNYTPPYLSTRAFYLRSHKSTEVANFESQDDLVSSLQDIKFPHRWLKFTTRQKQNHRTQQVEDLFVHSSLRQNCDRHLWHRAPKTTDRIHICIYIYNKAGGVARLAVDSSVL